MQTIKKALNSALLALVLANVSLTFCTPESELAVPQIDARPFTEKLSSQWADSLTSPTFICNTAIALFLTYQGAKLIGNLSDLVKSAGPEISKATAKMKPEDLLIHSTTTFKDVIGAQQAKDALQDVVNALRHPEQYKAIGARMPKGILLTGQPGTGKTTLAKALAGEAGVPFFNINGGYFASKYVAMGIERVKEVFTLARQHAPCIIFIDELDGAGSRMDVGSSADLEANRIINELLTQIDGIKNDDEEKPIIIIGATNFKDRIDPALLRSGRFDGSIEVDLPNTAERKQILELYGRKVRHNKNVNFAAIAERTENFCGADLENIVNQAALIAVRNKQKEILQKDFDAALEHVINSKKSAKSSSSNPQDILSSIMEMLTQPAQEQQDNTSSTSKKSKKS